jgi:hypothetical protein
VTDVVQPVLFSLHVTVHGICMRPTCDSDAAVKSHRDISAEQKSDSDLPSSGETRPK